MAKQKFNTPPLLPCGRPRTDVASITQKEAEKLRELLTRYLEKNQLKHSEQRWKIFQSILSMNGHLNAQEILKQVIFTHPDIGAATVYRNIKLLCDAKILKETLVDTEGKTVYELFDEEHHDHIVCEDCGHTFEFQNQELEALQDRIAKKSDFQPTLHRHVIYGKCLFKTKRQSTVSVSGQNK